LSAWQDGNLIDTLAAASAEAGQFKETIRWQEKAINLVPEKDQANYRTRLELYKAGKPYREPPLKV